MDISIVPLAYVFKEQWECAKRISANGFITKYFIKKILLNLSYSLIRVR